MKDKESDSSYSSVPPDDLEELVSGDDAVIGQALKWSAFAFVSLLVAGFVIYKFLNPGEEKIKPVNTLVEAPEQRVVSAEEYVPKVKFTDITTEAGIQFKHNNGATGDKLLPAAELIPPLPPPPKPPEPFLPVEGGSGLYNPAAPPPE